MMANTGRNAGRRAAIPSHRKDLLLTHFLPVPGTAGITYSIPAAALGPSWFVRLKVIVQWNVTANLGPRRRGSYQVPALHPDRRHFSPLMAHH